MQGKIHPLPRKKIISILKSNRFEQVKTIKGRHLKFRKRKENEINANFENCIAKHRCVVTGDLAEDFIHLGFF